MYKLRSNYRGVHYLPQDIQAEESARAKGGPTNPWNSLSMREKAEMIKVAVQNGITNLKDIRTKYNEFAEGGSAVPDGWTMEDENNYQQWRASLPENLRNTNDNDYDMRAAYKAHIQPTLENDGRYHLASRDPETGRILKAPYHPTYLQAINTDARLGYYPTVDNKGNTYTNTWTGNQFKGGGNKKKKQAASTVSPYAYKAMDYFMKKGLSRHAAAGLVGNLMRESGFNPTATNPYSGAYGLAQWLGPRKDKLFAKYGKNPTFDQQLDFAWWELNNTHKKGLQRLLNAPTAADAAADAMGYYEFQVGRQGAIDNMAKHKQDGVGAMKKGIANANLLMGLPADYSNIPLPEVATRPVELPTSQPAFMPINPEIFATVLPEPMTYSVKPSELATESSVAYAPKEIERQERQQGLRNFATIMGMLNPQDNSTMGIVDMLTANNYFSDGGGIHIKPSHRGRLTELKERTGKTEAELYNDGNPAHKKMVVFARNARRWKHGLGGNLFDDGGDKDNIFRYTNSNGNVRYVYQNNSEDEEVPVRPLNTIFPDPAQWTFTDDNGKFYTPRRTTPTDTAELNPDNRTRFERAVDNYIGEATNTIPKGYHTLPAIGAAAFGLASPALGEAALTSGFAAHGLTRALNGGIHGLGDAAMTALEIAPLGRLAKPILNTGIEVLEKYPALYQYPRYAVGKFKYGFDTQLPTLYRKVKNLPKIEDGRVMVSNPRSRFAFDNGYGEESPVITNFTTDAPVRSHSSGNWDRGLTLAFPGKTLLGKNVISTRPSDTFTFGNTISVPVGDVTAFTGRPKEISFLQSSGVKTISSPNAEVFWESGAADLADKIAKARATNAKIFSKRGSGITLLKPKTPVDNFDNYATTIENLARETFRSPTARDYEFMDYVFKPLYRSETIPKIDNFTMQTLDNYPALGEWIGNSERRRYLENPWRWENLMYDPLTPVESEFRKKLNIGLKPEFKK